MDNKTFITLCGGSNLKNTEIAVSLKPDIAFRLEVLAKQKDLSVSQYIISILSEHAEKELPKKSLEKYFL